MFLKSKNLAIACIALFCIAATKAQTIQFQGKTYMVYPYKMEAGNSIRNSSIGSELDIPFFPGKLKDGDYAVLFAISNNFDSTKFKSDYNLFKNKPAALFSVKNGLRNGPVVFYLSKNTTKNEPIIWATGYYSNGLRQGHWKMVNYSIYGMVTDSIAMNLDSGLLHGTYVQYKRIKGKMTIKSSLNYVRGLKQGAGYYQTDYLQQHYISNENGKKVWQLDSVFSYQKNNKGKYKKNAKRFLTYSKEISNTDSTFKGHVTFADNPNKYITVEAKKTSTSGYKGGDYISFFDFNKYLPLKILNVFVVAGSKTTLSELFDFPLDYHGSLTIHINQNEYKFNCFGLRLIEIPQYAETGICKEIYDHPLRNAHKYDHFLSYYYNYLQVYHINPTEKYSISNKKIAEDTVLGNLYHYVFAIGKDTIYEEKYHYSNGNFLVIYSNIFDKSANFYPEAAYYNDFKLETMELMKKNEFYEEYLFWIEGEYKNFRNWKSQSDRIKQLTGYPAIYFNNKTQNYELRRLTKATANDQTLEIVTLFEVPKKQLHAKEILEKGSLNTAYIWQNSPLYLKEKNAFFNTEDNYWFGEKYFPLKAPMVYYNGFPYTGHVNIGQSFKKNSIDLDLKIRKWHLFSDTTRWLTVKTQDYLSSNNLAFAASDGTIYGDVTRGQYYWSQSAKYEDGYLEGRIHLNNKNTISLNYKNKKLHGSQYFSGSSEGQTDFNLYENVLFGPLVVKKESNRIHSSYWQNDTPNGVFINYIEGEIMDSLNFKNGLPDGIYKQKTMYHRQAVETLHATFKNGIFNGPVKAYDTKGQLASVFFPDTTKPFYPMVFKKYQKAYILYSQNQNIKLKGQDIFDGKDSLGILPVLEYIDYNGRLRNELLDFNPVFLLDINNNLCSAIDLLKYNATWPGYHRYFYKSGIINQEGHIDSGKRVGTWKFYTESGVLFKEITYNKGELPDPKNPGKLMPHFGFCKGFNLKGQPLYEGYILDIDFTSSCATLADVFFENIYYTAIYDSTGRELIATGKPAPVTEIQITGAKHFDGWWKNGMRDSIWVFYSISGTPNAVGKYAKGQKEGRWISGDLTGINILDNACFEPENIYRIRQEQRKLDFTESFYKNGKTVIQIQTRVELDGTTYGYTDFKPMARIPWHWGKRKKSQRAYNTSVYKYAFKRKFKKLFRKRKRYRYSGHLDF